jgi:hypothetical protein
MNGIAFFVVVVKVNVELFSSWLDSQSFKKRKTINDCPLMTKQSRKRECHARFRRNSLNFLAN